MSSRRCLSMAGRFGRPVESKSRQSYAAGVRDFEPYRVDPKVALMSDFFVPDDDVPPPGVTVQALPSVGGVQKSS